MNPKAKNKKAKSDIGNLEKIAFKNICDDSNYEGLFRYLKVWWCSYYKRPSKDPILQEYTFEELIIEYFEQTLFNNKERYKELKEKWLLGVDDDDDWYKKFEDEVGPIVKAGASAPENIHEEF